MSATWQAFIATQALAQNAQSLAENALYPLDHGFITVAGIDAAKFLQGQLSCDIRLLNSSKAGLGSHSTAKGRMVSSFRIMQTASDAYLIRLHASIVESASAVLRKYIVFSKATLTLKDDWAGFGLHGADAKAQLAKQISHLPNTDFEQVMQGDLIVTCTSAELNSYEVYGPTEALTNLWQALSSDIALFNHAQHSLIEHQQGLAFIQSATVEEFVPQMLNYQATPAISFKKGCYTGQEIVARMQYLGKLKRHLYHCQLQGEDITVGESLSLTVDGQGSGTIASAVRIGDNLWDALVVLTDEASSAKTLYNKNGPVQLIRMIDLPYSVEK